MEKVRFYYSEEEKEKETIATDDLNLVTTSPLPIGTERVKSRSEIETYQHLRPCQVHRDPVRKDKHGQLSRLY